MDESVFFVGGWEVNPQAGIITDGPKTSRLEPRAMEVLVYLASKPDTVVSREKLERNQTGQFRLIHRARDHKMRRSRHIASLQSLAKP